MEKINKKAFGLALLASLSVSSPANASSIDFDCDTVADHFSSVSQKIDGHALAFSGTLRVVEKRNGRYLPLAGVLLSAADSARGADFIGFQIGASKNGGQASDVTFRDHSSTNAIIPLGQLPDAGDKIFTLTLSAEGILTLSIDGAVFRLDAPRSTKWNSVRVDMMCSTGQFKFFNTTLTGGK